MKKKLSKVGIILEKNEQQLIKGGSGNCDYYARINLCFADNDPYCKPCSQIGNYPGAASCMNLDNGCFEF